MKYSLQIELTVDQNDPSRKAPDAESVKMAMHHLIESGALRTYINSCTWNTLHNDDSFARIDVKCQST